MRIEGKQPTFGFEQPSPAPGDFEVNGSTLGGVSHAVLPDLSGLAALVKPELLDLAFASLPLEGERRDSNFINLNVN